MPNTVNSYIETDLGNVSPNPRGEYNAKYDYEYLDLIYYKGGSYLCLAPLGETIKNVPPIVGQTTTNWQCVAIPGDLTPEYISMYNEVVKDYNETNTNTADVAQMKADTYASMTAAQESESNASASETNARNSEVNAKQSMDNAKEYSDEAIRVNNDTQSLVTGFDEHVATAISNAEASISESTDNAKGEIVAQKSSSLNEFRIDAETVMTNEKNVAVAEIHQMVDDFSADADSKKQEVIQVADEKINDMTALKNDTVNAKNAAETAATNAVEKAEESANSANNSKVSENAVTEMKISIEQSQSDIQTKQIQVSSDAQQVSSDKSDILIMKSSIEDTAEKVNIDVQNGLKQISDSKDNSLADIQNKKNEVIADIEQYGALQVSNEEPISENVDLWINPDNEEEYSIPEIKDSEVNASDTWSSEKIFGEISELKGDLAELEIISNEYLISKNANLLNINDTGVEIGYYNTENGKFVSNDNALTSAFIPYDNNSTYSASYPTNWFIFIVSLWDGNKNIIKFSMVNLPIAKTGNHFTLQPTTYSNAKYIKFTIFDMNKDFTTAMVVKDMEYPSEYIPYGYHYSEKNNEHISDIFSHLIYSEKNNEHIVDIVSKLPKPAIFDNKVLLFTGDSICYGAGWRPDPEDFSNTGWRKIIQEDYPNSITYGYGVGGTTISKRDGRTDSILERMTTMFSEHPEADYIIIQGGVNDAYNITDCPIGTISTGYTDEVNENTFAGALESIFKYAQTNWLGKKIGYIVTFKVPSAMGQFKFNEYMDIAKQICEKWSVPYCDLYNESNLNYYIQEVSNAYGGGLHPNEAGYRIITNKIEKWLETL